MTPRCTNPQPLKNRRPTSLTILIPTCSRYGSSYSYHQRSAGTSRAQTLTSVFVFLIQTHEGELVCASALEALVAAHWKPDELQAVLRHPKVKVRDEHSNPALFLSEFTAPPHESLTRCRSRRQVQKLAIVWWCSGTEGWRKLPRPCLR